jgi:hypothetical protein
MTVGSGLFGLLALAGLTVVPVALAQGGTLQAPQSVVATANSETQITLTWSNPNPGTTSTSVERGTTASGPWTAVTGSPVPSKNSQTITDSGRAAWTVYYYRLQVTSNGSSASPYATASARTLDTTPPTNGTATATASESKVTVSWSGVSDAASGLALNPYKVVFATGSSPASCASGTTIFTGGSTSYMHTALTNGTTYYYRVCAADNAGNTSSGAIASAVPRDTTAPSGSMTINSNTAYTNSLAASLNLSATDTVGVTGYYVSATSTVPSAGAAGWVAVTSTTSLSTSTSYTVGAGDGTKTVYAWYKDLAGNVSATTSDTIVLDQTVPTNGTLTATPGSSQVSLTWSGFSDATSGLASTNTYKLVSGTGSSPASCSAGTQLLLGTATSYTHTGLTNGTPYYYRVCAFDKAGNTSSGATASATPQPADTTAPTGSVTINSNAAYTATTAVTLNLSATDSIGVRGYYLSTSSTPPLATAAGWVTVTSTTSFSTNVSYTLTAGDGTKTVYAWYKDAAGNVSATASDAIVLDQTAPANGLLTASPGNTQISLAWSGFSDPTSYLATTSPYKLVFNTSSPASCSVGTVIYTGTALSFVHTGRTNGTTYFYRVCATDNAGNMSTGATANATPQASDTAPSGSVTINANAGYTKTTAVTLNLTATDGVGVTAYYVSTNSTAPSATAPGWTSVTSTPSYSASVNYTLSAGDGAKTVYVWYKDAAANVSAVASDTIVLDQTLPTNGALTSTPGSAQVQLSWSGFSDLTSGLAATNTYKLVFATGAVPASCSAGTQLALGTATTYTHTGLTNGTTYSYRVCANDNAGNMSSGAIANATPVVAGDTTPPACSITINGNAQYTATTAVTLNLAATDNVGVTGYYVSTSSTTPSATAPGWTAVTSTTSFSSSVPYTLPSGDGTKTVYAWYRDAAGNVSTSSMDTIKLDQTPPTNGTVTATGGTGQVVLGWGGFSDATSLIANYKVVFATPAAPTSCASGTPIYLGTGTTFTHTGLTNGTTYSYRVCAVDNAGNTSTGSTASATPAPTLAAFSWDVGAGDTGDDRGNAIAVDGSGNVFATGHFVGTINLGGTSPLTSTLISPTSGPSQDAYLVKYSPAGDHLWSKKVGGNGLDEGRGVAVDGSGNVIVVGSSQSTTIDFGGGLNYSIAGDDIFVAKYSPTGGYVWGKMIGGYGSDVANAVATDSGGNVIVAGAFDVSITGVDFGGGALFSAGSTDVFVVKYSPTGAHVWSKRFGGSGLDGATAVAVDRSGNVVVVGYFNGTVNVGGGNLVSAGANDIFVAKYSGTNGAHLWSKRLGASTADVANRVTVDSIGDVIVIGSFTGSVNFGGGALASAGAEDIFVVKYSGVDGSHVWSKRFGSTGSDVGYGVAVDHSDNLVITGYFSGSVDFGGGALTASSYDVFVAKLSPTGVHQWSRDFGGVNPQVGSAVAVDKVSGNASVTGYFWSSVDFGGGALTSTGGADLFITNLGP